MHTNIDGYRTQRGSDIKRDGIFIELIATESGDEVAEVFYSDQTKKMQISIYASELPLEAVEYLIARAKLDLPEQNHNEK